VCTYNRAYSLEKCLSSIIEQSYTNIEIIIINDGSNDSTSVILNEFDFKKIPHKIHSNTQNLGLQKSLNIALSYASGSLIARLDDDDQWIHKDKLEIQVKEFQKDHSLTLLGTAFSIDNGAIYNPVSDEKVRLQILFRCPFQHSTVMFRSTIAGLETLYDDTLEYGEDWELWLRLGLKGKIGNLNLVTANITNKNNMSSVYYAKQHINNFKILFRYFRFYPKTLTAIYYHIGLILYFGLHLHKTFIHQFMHRFFSKQFLEKD